MEQQQNEVESIIAPLKKVTPLSKYLALALFILMPFVGGWIGYVYAPEKVVEVLINSQQITSDGVSGKSSENTEEDFILIGGGYYQLKSNAGDKIRIFYKNNYWTGTTTDGIYNDIQHITYIEIPEVDVDSFKIDENHNDYASDVNNVYYFSRSPFESTPDDGVKIIYDADPKTFEAKIVRLFDVSQGNTYQGWISRDATHVYYESGAIEGADPDTYRISDYVSINYDNNDVFLWHKKILEADPLTYEVLFDTSSSKRGTVFGKDKSQCFKNYEIFDCAEMPKSYDEAIELSR